MFIRIITLTIIFLLLPLSAVTAQNVTPSLIDGTEDLSYESMGFLLNQTSNISVTLCGFVVLSENTGMTAAHCLDEEGDLSVGFSVINIDETTEVLRSEINPLWDQENSEEDYAGLIFEEASFSNIATVSSPTTGCGYTVSSYGNTSLDSGDPIDGRNKEVLDVCIKELSESTFIIYAENTGGFCYGDSGSPIYRTGTEEVVGIISATRFYEEDGDTTCESGNEVIAVRLDNKSEFINSLGQDEINDDEPEQDDPLDEPDPVEESLGDGDIGADTPEDNMDNVTELPRTNLINNSFVIAILGLAVIALGASFLRK